MIDRKGWRFKFTLCYWFAITLILIGVAIGQHFVGVFVGWGVFMIIWTIIVIPNWEDW